MFFSGLLSLSGDWSCVYRLLDCLFHVVSYPPPRDVTAKQLMATWYHLPADRAFSNTTITEFCQRIADKLEPSSVGVLGRAIGLQKKICIFYY
jgi:hypothetical protein